MKASLLPAKASRCATSTVGGMLQRKCACGGAPAQTGECEAGRHKQLQKVRNSNRGIRNDSLALPPEQGMPQSHVQPLGASARVFMEPRFAQDFSAVPATNSQRPANVPGAPANSFEDCPIDWQTKADAALARGRPWVANVITGLVNLPTPIPAPVAGLLNRHFHTTKQDDIREIVRHFNSIYSAMNASIDFECETSCDANVAAYVYSVWTDLHLCPVWHSLSPESQANTIIHEIAHDAANRD